MIISKATPRDAEGIIKNLFIAYEKNIGYNTTAFLETKEILINRMKDPEWRIYVVKDGSTVVASISFKMDIDNGSAYMCRFFSLKKTIGKKLLIEALNKIKDLEIKRVIIRTFPQAKKLVAFYYDFGFVESNKHIKGECKRIIGSEIQDRENRFYMHFDIK